MSAARWEPVDSPTSDLLALVATDTLHPHPGEEWDDFRAALKRRDLMRSLRRMAKEAGVEFESWEGGSHTKVRFGGRQTVVPRHSEVNEKTAKAVLRHMKGE